MAKSTQKQSLGIILVSVFILLMSILFFYIGISPFRFVGYTCPVDIPKNVCDIVKSSFSMLLLESIGVLALSVLGFVTVYMLLKMKRIGLITGIVTGVIQIIIFLYMFIGLYPSVNPIIYMPILPIIPWIVSIAYLWLRRRSFS
jgi:hypothetical protein